MGLGRCEIWVCACLGGEQRHTSSAFVEGHDRIGTPGGGVVWEACSEACVQRTQTSCHLLDGVQQAARVRAALHALVQSGQGAQRAVAAERAVAAAEGGSKPAEYRAYHVESAGMRHAKWVQSLLPRHVIKHSSLPCKPAGRWAHRSSYTSRLASVAPERSMRTNCNKHEPQCEP